MCVCVCGFVRSNIFPIPEIVKPEIFNQYIINITYTSNINYTSNIYSPIVDYSIITTENNTTNNIIQPDNEIN